MEMTTYDMERQAATPMAAPVGAVASGRRLSAPNVTQVHGTPAPIAPWTTGYDRHIGRLFGRGMAGHPARRLGRPST